MTRALAITEKQARTLIRAAENGANALDLSAMYGWHDPRQAEVYIRKANRKVMAERAANALSPHLEPTAPAPKRKCLK